MTGTHFPEELDNRHRFSSSPILQLGIPLINAVLVFGTELSQPDGLILGPRAFLIEHIH